MRKTAKNATKKEKQVEVPVAKKKGRVKNTEVKAGKKGGKSQEWRVYAEDIPEVKVCTEPDNWFAVSICGERSYISFSDERDRRDFLFGLLSCLRGIRAKERQNAQQCKEKPTVRVKSPRGKKAAK